MDVTSALRGDAFRPFATIVSPGALGIAPFAMLLYGYNDAASAFWDAHPIATGMALFIASLAAGFVFENIGARVEVMIDRRIAKRDAMHMDYWQRYLLLAFPLEPVGQRYLRTLQFRMKFELGILGSLPAQLVGWLMLLSAMHAAAYTGFLLVVAFVLVAAWFYFEAFDSAQNLSGIRRRLVEAFERQ
ncbi:MAG TPA: hypothetical protein VJR92_13215 [Gemmatimonadaceae bacterium]|nr:hypothetical protein [Gemmatimonadaceae bacterium]